MQTVNPGDPAAVLDFVRGDGSGLAIPTHGEALRAAGEEFLTEALRRFGALGADNRVTRITRIEPFAGGNSGQKVRFSVEYAAAAPGLHNDLFAKFSRDFTDPFRDRRRHELESEVRFAALSRNPRFPIHVPKPYFADIQRDSGTGLLITQQIAFGSGGIEPLLTKCMDHELAQPLAYYRSIVTALARLAGAHKSGSLAPDVETLFPFDAAESAAADPIPWSEPQLDELIDRYAEFARNCPRLLPANVTTPAFISQLRIDSRRFLRSEAAVKRFLQADRDFVALCHYNANIDNAWFWRDPAGELQSGLLDWGRVRQMNVAYALWGSLCAASLELWNEHLDELLDLFVRELHAQGGPLLDARQLERHLHLYAATIGLAMLIQAPTLVLTRLPLAVHAFSPLDPILRTDEVARGFLHVFTTFLNLWQSRDFGASLDWALRNEPR